MSLPIHPLLATRSARLQLRATQRPKDTTRGAKEWDSTIPVGRSLRGRTPGRAARVQGAPEGSLGHVGSAPRSPLASDRRRRGRSYGARTPRPAVPRPLSPPSPRALGPGCAHRRAWGPRSERSGSAGRRDTPHSADAGGGRLTRALGPSRPSAPPPARGCAPEGPEGRARPGRAEVGGTACAGRWAAGCSFLRPSGVLGRVRGLGGR